PLTPRPPRPSPLPAAKIDPKYLAAARQLRDVWMERANDGMLALPAPRGKYDVSRTLDVGGGGSGVGGRQIQPPTTHDQPPTELLLAG
ncbi:MAG: hypothetical protein WBD40_04115, partial [Tepidisphaeraceae bacterium]